MCYWMSSVKVMYVLLGVQCYGNVCVIGCPVLR